MDSRGIIKHVPFLMSIHNCRIRLFMYKSSYTLTHYLSLAQPAQKRSLPIMNPLDPWYHIRIAKETPPHIVLLAARLRQERQLLAYQHWLEQQQRSEHQQYLFGRTTPWAILQLEMLLQQEAYAQRQALLLQQLATHPHACSSSLGEGSLSPLPADDHVIDNFVNDGSIYGTHAGSIAASPPSESRARTNSELDGSRPGRNPPSRTSSPTTGRHSYETSSSSLSAQSIHGGESASSSVKGAPARNSRG